MLIYFALIAITRYCVALRAQYQTKMILITLNGLWWVSGFLFYSKEAFDLLFELCVCSILDRKKNGIPKNFKEFKRVMVMMMGMNGWGSYLWWRIVMLILCSNSTKLEAISKNFQHFYNEFNVTNSQMWKIHSINE